MHGGRLLRIGASMDLAFGLIEGAGDGRRVGVGARLLRTRT